MSQKTVFIRLIGILFFLFQSSAVNADYFSFGYNKDIDAYVYSPPVLEEGVCYPVLYLVHGQGQDPYVWEEIGLSDSLSLLYERGEIIPFFIILVHDAAYLEDMYASKFYENFTETVMPYVEENFPVSTDPNLTAVGGISRGAQWAQYLAFGEYGRFAHVGVHSPANAFFSFPKIYRIISDHPEVPTLRIRIDIGNEDIYILSGSDFSTQLLKLYYPHEYVLGVGGHNVDYWSQNLESYLKWYSEGFETYLAQ